MSDMASNLGQMEVSKRRDERGGVRPLRVWPAVVLGLLMLAARFGPGLVEEEGDSTYWVFPVFGPLLCCLLLTIWWLAASRATWRERLFGLVGLAGAATAMVMLAHPTMRGSGTTYFTLPAGFLLFVVAAVLLRNGRPGVRTSAAVLAALAGFSTTLFFRNEGMTGDYGFELRARWTVSREEALIASRKEEIPAVVAFTNAAVSTNAFANAEWPGFRGADRSGRAKAGQISTNWAVQPPQQLWKIQVGPGWSSFAVAGKRLFTQEQRGPKEAVVCFDGDSGREIWRTEIEARLEDPMGGPGPRATPTLADGALFVTGSTGAFMRIDPADGRIVWRKELGEVAGRGNPTWGYSASPLVVGAMAIVYAGGPGEKGLLGFDAGTGELRWSAPTGADGYTSPQLESFHGEELVSILCNHGLLLVEPATGRTRLNYEWKVKTYRAVQPRQVGTNVLVLTTGLNVGTRALRIEKSNGELKAEEIWTSRNLKPDFVDFVTHEGHIYGNDNGILTCLDLKSGERKWKGGRYGKGQMLLLEEAGLLLIATEQGQVVLVKADPADHVEVASFKALEGKTWNHPVLVGDRLYVRNSQEAAAYRLPTVAATNLAAAKIP